MISWVLLIIFPLINSFTPPSSIVQYVCSNQRIDPLLRNSKQDNNNEEIDSMRKKLESLIENQEKECTSYNHTPLLSKTSKPRVLSSSSRKILIAEMKLLQSLKDSDSAVSVLWSFWFSEQGIEEGKDLVDAERLASLGNMNAAEEKFIKLIKKHGNNWAEPMNRYATMLYQQGRLEESKLMCENVLSLKPWHFGALSGIELVCDGLNDTVNAEIWSSRKLPLLSFPDKRKEWVDRALQEISNILSEKQSETIAGLDPDSFDDAWS